MPRPRGCRPSASFAWRARGRRLHVLHVTTADEIPLLAGAKEDLHRRDHAAASDAGGAGMLRAPGHLRADEPPIRDGGHRDALWAAVNQGVIDVIGSDHAPHTRAEKDKTYPDTPSGLPGCRRW